MKKRNDVWNMRLLQAHSVPNSLEKRIQQQIKCGERQERQGKRGAFSCGSCSGCDSDVCFAGQLLRQFCACGKPCANYRSACGGCGAGSQLKGGGFA